MKSSIFSWSKILVEYLTSISIPRHQNWPYLKLQDCWFLFMSHCPRSIGKVVEPWAWKLIFNESKPLVKKTRVIGSSDPNFWIHLHLCCTKLNSVGIKYLFIQKKKRFINKSSICLINNEGKKRWVSSAAGSIYIYIYIYIYIIYRDSFTREKRVKWKKVIVTWKLSLFPFWSCS